MGIITSLELVISTPVKFEIITKIEKITTSQNCDLWVLFLIKLRKKLVLTNKKAKIIIKPKRSANKISKLNNLNDSLSRDK